MRQLSIDDSSTTFAELIRGTESLGALFAAEGYPAIPSPTDAMPLGTDYFNGGYNSRRHGCVDGGEICAIQIEANRIGVRDSDGGCRTLRRRGRQGDTGVPPGSLGPRYLTRYFPPAEVSFT